MMTFKKKPLVINLLLLVSSCAWATTPASNQTQNIGIQADHMQLNLKTKKTVYTGHVLIKKPLVELTGDTVTIKRNKDNKIDSIISTGKPAQYLDKTVKDKATLARAEILQFYPIKHMIILKIHASIQQGTDKIYAPIIHYNTQTRVITAFGNKKTQIQMNVKEGNSSL